MKPEYTLKAYKDKVHERWGIIPVQLNLYMGYSSDLDEMVKSAKSMAQGETRVYVVDKMGRIQFTAYPNGSFEYAGLICVCIECDSRWVSPAGENVNCPNCDMNLS